MKEEHYVSFNAARLILYVVLCKSFKMKSRFTTFDIKAIVHELQQRLAGLRVVNVYDIDTKTYLIKLAKTDEKAVLLLESGIRLHTTEFEWPKNIMPSGFAMKMRKHLKGRRLEKVEQLGVDRIVDLQFGSSEAAYHVILELYDRGNIILTDHEYTILNIQRPRTDDSQDVRFAVRERYPVELAKKHEGPMTMESLMSVLMAAQEGDNLKKILNPHLVYGGSLIEHSLLLVGLNINARLGHDFKIAEDASRLLEALHQAETIMADINVETSQGYIIQQKEKKAVVADVGENEVLMTYSEFHPYLFKQHEHQPNVPFSFFDRAVDEFFSKIESQKQDRKLIQQEKTALKKLDGIKNEHVKRLDALKTGQEVDTRKAKFIEMNLPMVDRAITVIRSALANQIDWPEIEQMIEEATQLGDVVASSIKSLKLDTNHFTMLLKVPTDSDDESDDADSHEALKPLKVDIDLGLSAYANARKYYDMKRHAAVKEQKTVDATEKAMKSAERKTKMTLKEVRMVATINKARKTFWFEKFLWFISSENYIVIGGRDQQQNEIIVKRYLKPGDLYVHADLHGASSIVIKNPSKEPVPPKTLNEAGTMALCYSAAWDAKVVTSSWWVYHDQVSKTAPSGEYLTTGSFMIRGKKNYLPPSHLIYGFGFLFKADESCVFRHKNERRVRTIEEEEVFSVTDSANDVELKDSVNDDLCSVDEEDEEKPEGNNVSSDSETEEQRTDEKNDDLAQNESEEEQDDGDDDEAAGKKGIPDATSHVENEICDFPDTSIQLHHVKGGEFRLTKEISVHDGPSENNSASVPESQSGCEQDAGPKVARLSAKQRRELKKKKKVGEQSEGVNEEKPEELGELESPAAVNERLEPPPTQSETKGGQKEEVETEAAGNEQLASHPTQSQAKRGQKAKLKKIKEKYGDQDEEERQLKMELLASSRGPKEEKLKKGKKGKQQQQQLKNKQLAANDGKKQGQVKGKPQGRLTIHDIRDDKSVFTAHPDGGVAEELGDDKSTAEAAALAKTDDAEADEDGQEGLEEDGGQIMQDADLLNSLTGIPDAEDILLFSIPVCAPYSAMVNYKYRVKLVPGTTRRGKAAKTALNMFLYDKTAVAREKDLLKILKDTDVSRNMPGKVKVSAPNLHKQKHK